MWKCRCGKQMGPRVAQVKRAKYRKAHYKDGNTGMEIAEEFSLCPKCVDAFDRQEERNKALKAQREADRQKEREARPNPFNNLMENVTNAMFSGLSQ